MKLIDFLGLVPDYITIQVLDFNYGSPNSICSIFSNDLVSYDFSDLHSASVISVEPVSNTLSVTVLL